MDWDSYIRATQSSLVKMCCDGCWEDMIGFPWLWFAVKGNKWCIFGLCKKYFRFTVCQIWLNQICFEFKFVRLCTVKTCFELHTLIPVLVIVIRFQGHNNRKKIKINHLSLSTFLVLHSWVEVVCDSYIQYMDVIMNLPIIHKYPKHLCICRGYHWYISYLGQNLSLDFF